MTFLGGNQKSTHEERSEIKQIPVKGNRNKIGRSGKDRKNILAEGRAGSEALR